MTPTLEDYAINLQAVLAANQAATQGEWISIDQHDEKQVLITRNHNAMPGIIRRLLELEEAVLTWDTSFCAPYRAACDVLEAIADRIREGRAAQHG